MGELDFVIIDQVGEPDQPDESLESVIETLIGSPSQDKENYPSVIMNFSVPPMNTSLDELTPLPFDPSCGMTNKKKRNGESGDADMEEITGDAHLPQVVAPTKGKVNPLVEKTKKIFKLTSLEIAKPKGF